MRFFHSRTEIVRLRVIANSDTEEDQAIKIRVRDAVMDALCKATLSVPSIRAIAQSIDPTAKVRWGWFHFGGYASRALQITIGVGAGHNWWGILFPTACHLPEDTMAQFDSWFVNLLKRWGWL